MGCLGDCMGGGGMRPEGEGSEVVWVREAASGGGIDISGDLRFGRIFAKLNSGEGVVRVIGAGAEG